MVLCGDGWCLTVCLAINRRRSVYSKFYIRKRSQSKSYPLVFVAGGRSLSMQSPHPVNILDGLLCPYISLMFVCLFVCRFVINRHIVSLRTFRLSIHRRTGIDRHRSNTFDSPTSAQRSCTHITDRLLNPWQFRIQRQITTASAVAATVVVPRVTLTNTFS